MTKVKHAEEGEEVYLSWKARQGARETSSSSILLSGGTFLSVEKRKNVENFLNIKSSTFWPREENNESEDTTMSSISSVGTTIPKTTTRNKASRLN